MAAELTLVGERLGEVRARVRAAALRSGREPDDVTLIAVSKAHSVDTILQAYDAGHRDFGENRAQELAEKAPQLPTDIRWHFVGSLQSRKAKQVRPVAAVLHSLDRESLVDVWARGEGPPPPALVQINLAREPQKGGALPEDAAPLVQYAIDRGVQVDGLMAIPPAPEVEEDSRRWFDELAALRRELAGRFPTLVELSMGMTDDFEVAIEAGSSMIRVGRAIFGPRPTG
ncbi:MAG: YggS family pyridoxal phosphate-dependent enzyme [Acidimicrobiia bacterium]|nr:YggS family pyridoxal phosphate-dependent enzyme [Acidimicrobiia bacterium]